MSPIGVLVLVICLSVVAFAPRRWAIMGMLGGVLFLPQSQQLAVAGINVFGMRFLEVAAIFRIFARKEYTTIKLTRLDKLLLIFFIYSTIVFLLRSDDGQAYQIGLAVDALGCYFAFRSFIKDDSDIRWMLKAFVWMLVPFTAMVVVESLTLNNPFATLMGGINYGGDWMRNGRLRCQGSFRHSSLLGTFGASFISLYIASLVGRFDRKQAFIGIGSCLVIVWACNSGGPISCVANVVFCWVLWRFRQRLKIVKRSLLVVLVLMAVVMEAPIFYLPAKVSSITGGDGWHRSFLMEVSFHDLDKWWMFGMPLSQTIDWFPYHTPGTGFADITNQFIAYGLDSGLLAIVLCIAFLSAAFREIGFTLKTSVEIDGGPSPVTYITWGLASALVMHIANWLGIIYFDQTYVIWYLQLAMIGSLRNQMDPISARQELEAQPDDNLSSSNSA